MGYVWEKNGAKNHPPFTAGERKSDKAKSVRKYTKKKKWLSSLIIICLEDGIQHDRCALGAVLGA